MTVKYNRLLVNSTYMCSKTKETFARCLCGCGNEKDIRLASLVIGHTKSCGCLKDEKVAQRMTKHGKYKDRIYRIWSGMVQRCTNKKSTNYKNYGGRGISVCDEWLLFDNFYKDMGDDKKGLTLDRIDNDKGYTKENCRWATYSEQADNKRIRCDNRTGVAGVEFWGDRFRCRVKGSHLGIFNTFEEAVGAVNDARCTN